MKKRLFAAALALCLSLSAVPTVGALGVEDARKLLREHYVDPIPQSMLEQDTLEGMLAALNDPYTVYLSPEGYQEFLTAVDGDKVTGIGVSIQGTYMDGFEILAVLPDSPALEAGLVPGDKLIAVNGQPLTAESNVTALVAGEEGTEVTITLRRADRSVLEVTMTRRAVQIPIVTYEVTDDHIGYVDCTSFGESTFSTVKQALTELDKKVSVWVMDLRSNPGGTATAAAGTAGLFLGQQTMTYFRDADGDYRNYYTTAVCPDLSDKPLIILTSPHSASGSELFSAAIRDYGAGIAIGQRTLGKGVAQSVYDKDTHPELFEGDALKVTTFRFFSPDGATNHICGILPTLLVAPEHTPAIAKLLSTPLPEQSFGYFKLEVAGQALYLNLEQLKENPEAAAELLAALPPDAKLYRGAGRDMWEESTAQKLADRCKLTYQPRTFADAENSPYRREIDTLTTYGLLSGCGDDLFHPDWTLTRGQLAAMLAAALDLPVSDTAPAYSDVAEDAWYAPAVSAMTARGFLSGTGEGTFSPHREITMEEMVVILSQIYAWGSMEGFAQQDESLRPDDFLTYYAYPEWARTAARDMAQIGLDVDPEAPEQIVSREMAAGMICRLLEHMHMLWNR